MGQATFLDTDALKVAAVGPCDLAQQNRKWGWLAAPEGMSQRRGKGRDPKTDPRGPDRDEVIKCFGLVHLRKKAHPQFMEPSVDPSSPVTAAAPRASEELIEAKAQVRAMQEFRTAILATVHWTLGVVLTLGMLLFGFNWYANFRVSEREREALREQLQSEVDSLRAELLKASGEIRNKMQADVREEVRNSTADLGRALRAEIDRLHHAVLSQKLETARMGEVRESELLVLLQIVEQSKKDGHNAYLDSALVDLEACLMKTDSLTPKNLQAIETTLSTLGTENSPAVSRIRARLKSIKPFILDEAFETLKKELNVPPPKILKPDRSKQ